MHKSYSRQYFPPSEAHIGSTTFGHLTFAPCDFLFLAHFFTHRTLLPDFIWFVFQPNISVQTGFQRLEIAAVDSTTDHFELLLVQCEEHLNTKSPEPAGEIANCGEVSY